MERDALCWMLGALPTLTTAGYSGAPMKWGGPMSMVNFVGSVDGLRNEVATCRDLFEGVDWTADAASSLGRRMPRRRTNASSSITPSMPSVHLLHATTSILWSMRVRMREQC